MEIEVVGRHALLFDDDAMAAFVNSQEALIHWNSLLIDRYDVRHLLHSLPTFTKRRTPPLSDPDDGVSLSDLDRERYLDLPPDDCHEDNASEGRMPNLLHLHLAQRRKQTKHQILQLAALIKLLHFHMEAPVLLVE